MRKVLMVSALALATVTTGGFAAASDNGIRVNVPKEQWLSFAQIAEKLTAQGYDIREIEIDDGVYEVSAVKDGQRVKSYLHPATGEILKQKTRR